MADITQEQFGKMISAVGGNEVNFRSNLDSLLKKENRELTSKEKTNLYKAWMTYGSNKSRGNTGGSTTGMYDFLRAEESGGYFRSVQEEYVKSSTLLKEIQNINNQNISQEEKKNQIAELWNAKLIDNFNQYLDDQKLLLEEINVKAGMTGKLSEEYRENITKVQPELLRIGIGYGDLASSAVNLIDQTGKFNLMSTDSFYKMGEVTKLFGGSLESLVSMFPEFEKIGVGAIDATQSIREASNSSLLLGLQAKKTVKDLSDNVGKLNEYGFKNGIKGLTEMVQKSTQFRMNLENVYTIAEKVMNPEGAIELTANLQVLGGAIGDFNDPLKLMYMATNNVEGLQDALIGAAGGLATYNSEQKRFEIAGVNLRRAREMASQLGISYQDLNKGAIAAAERMAATNDLMSRGLTFEKPEDMEFIKNIAQMKGGKMVIDIGGSTALQSYFKRSEVALDTLTDNEKEKILQFKKDLEKKDERDIIRGQATAVENINRNLSFVAASMRLAGGKAAETAAELTGFNLIKDLFTKNVEEGSTEIGDFLKSTTQYIQNLKTDDNDTKTLFQSELNKLMGKVTKEPNIGEVSKPQNTITEETYRKTETSTTNMSTTPKETSTQKVQVEYIWKTDPAADEISRMMQKYPHLFVDWENPNSYTKTKQG
jgi:hypothetical protein